MTTIRNIVILAFFIGLSSFHRPVDLGALIASLKTGDATSISGYLDRTVNISMPGHSGAYEKKEARKIIDLFFAQHPIKTFRLIHKSDFSGSQMCVGTLVTDNGVFRTTFLIEEISGEQSLKEIRFE